MQCSSCDFAQSCGDGGAVEAVSAGYFSRHSAGSTEPSDVSFCDPFNEGLERTQGKSFIDDRCGRCPVGYHCDGTNDPVPCEPGKYGLSQGEVSETGACFLCPEGKYCLYLATEEEKLSSFDCSDGYYCNGSSIPRPIDGAMGGLCQVGRFCEKGLTYECESGTFMGVTGSSECKITRIGYYQDQSGQDTALDCPEGKYCDQNGLASTPENCTVGTYYSGTNLISSSSCTPCDPGYVCPETGLTSSSEICLSGSFCPGGNAQQNDNICDQGYYCSEGSIAQQICLPGTFCPLGATEMTNCTAGYHCIEGSVTARGVTDTNGEKRCSVGHYCPEGTPTEVTKLFVYILCLKKKLTSKRIFKKNL